MSLASFVTDNQILRLVGKNRLSCITKRDGVDFPFEDLVRHGGDFVFEELLVRHGEEGPFEESILNLDDFLGRNRWGQFEWDGKGFSKDAKEVFLKIESDSKEPMLYAKLPDKIYRELVQQKVNLSERIFNDNGKLGFLSRKDKSLPFTAGEIGTLKFDYEHVIFVELKNDHDDWTCSELDLNFYIGNHDGQFAWDSSCYQSPDTRNIQFMVLGTAKIPYLRAELRNNRGEWNLRTLNLSERIINSNGTLVVRPAN